MKWRRYFVRRRRDDELANEIDSYLRHEADDNLARGMTREEARLAAHRKFGNTTLVREVVYDMNTWNVFDALRKDLNYALRQLRLNPGFALTAIVSLALGIGANTAIFTLSDQILLRLLPVERPQELVQLRVEGGRIGSQSGDGVSTFPHPTFLALRDTNTVFSGLTGQVIEGASLSAGDRNEVVALAMVAGNYFDVLVVKPFKGRLLTAEDDRARNGSPVAVLQYDFWRNRFGGRDDILGSTIRLEGSPFTVIGIAAPGFEGTNVGFATNLWVPVTMKPTLTPTDEDIDEERYSWFYLFARLKPGVTLAQAEAAMKVTYRQRQEVELNGPMFQQYPQLRDKFLKQQFSLVPAERGQSSLRRQFERPLIVLAWVVGAVLLIACANVAGLLLARAAARQREMAIRGALGASRGQLIRQLLVESLLLGCGGAAAAVLISGWITQALVRIVAPDPSRISLSTTPDTRILIFTAALTLTATLLFGLLPAWQASRTPVAPTLKESAGAIAGTPTQVRLRKAFVAFQVGVSTLLVIAAGLFARTLGSLRDIDLGFQTENVATFRVGPATVYDNPRKLQLYRSLIEGLATVPGVKAVGANRRALLTGGRADGSISLPGVHSDGVNPQWSYFSEITPGYFEALGIPILAGRDLSWKDWGSSHRYCLVNEALVKEYLNGRNAAGLSMGRGMNVPLDYEIIGVVGNSRYDDVRGSIPRQTFFALDSRIEYAGDVTVYARMDGDPRTVMTQLRAQVNRIDSNLVITNMRTMDDQVNLRLANERVLSFLSAGFALLAVLLAATGLYGVLTFVVARRSREIGIRMALGAAQSSVIRMVLREMALVILAGIAAGAGAAFYCGRFLATQLYGVKPDDTQVFLTSIAVLLACSVGAAFLPSWRASRLDPMAALRQD